jgi:hypothetical protein
MLFHALLALAAASSPGSDSVARDPSVTPARNEASAPARRHTTFGVAIARFLNPFARCPISRQMKV